MADPRDYIMQAGEGLQQGLSAYAADQEKQKYLDTPLPDFLQSQINPPVPTNPVSLADVRAASPDYQPGQGQPAWANSQPNAPDQWSPPEAASLGSVAPPQQSGGSVADEHPEVDRVAHAYARGEMSIQDALAHAKKYTYRDMPAVDTFVKMRGQKTAEDMANIEKERTQRAFGVQERKNEGARDVANIKDQGVDREGRRKFAMLQEQIAAKHEDVQAQIDAMLQKAEIIAKAARARGDQQVPAEFRMLQAESVAAGKKMDSAVRDLTSNNALVDDSYRADAQIAYNKAKQEFDRTVKQLHSFNQAYGGNTGPQPGSGVMAPGQSLPPQNGADAGSPPVQEPPASMNVPPPPTHSGRPDNALPPEVRDRRMNQGRPAPAPAPQVNMAPNPDLSQVGTVKVRRKRDGVTKVIPISRANAMVQTGEFELVH